jgi:hypothetical protein
MEKKLKTVIDKETGQELRAQFHDQIEENEMLIEDLRTEPMENPYWDFVNEVFYDKIITNEENN